MRAIVGIDAEGIYHPALDLLKRFEFPKLITTLVHISDPTFPYSDSRIVSAEMSAEFARISHDLGEAALHGAVRHACLNDLAAKSKMLVGKPAGALMAECESELADVVAVCTGHKENTSLGYLGSVSRALAISCPTSVLVAKEPLEGIGPMTAVFATDHSGFADKCLARFLKLAPKGISQVNVVSAYDVDDREAAVLRKNIAMLGGDVDRYVAEFVEQSNARVCRQLSDAGYASASIVAKGNPKRVIHDAMKSTQSDLVIVGSQGNGFFDRALIGSVSLHQVVAEKYPVLIIRP